MANLSDLTRRQQVLVYLRHYANQWIAGPDLANEQVGGSEGLKRLRELRQEGHDIRMRKHPDRDIWEYTLVEGGPSAAISEETTAINQPPSVVQHIEPAEKPVYPRPTGRPKMGDAVVRKEDGTYEYVPPSQALTKPSIAPDPPQPDSFRFTRMPAKLDFGTMAICHRCKGKKLPERWTSAGKHLPADDFCRDPRKRTDSCHRCGGFGVVPNRGPIPITMPEDQT